MCLYWTSNHTPNKFIFHSKINRIKLVLVKVDILAVCPKACARVPPTKKNTHTPFRQLKHPLPYAMTTRTRLHIKLQFTGNETKPSGPAPKQNCLSVSHWVCSDETTKCSFALIYNFLQLKCSKNFPSRKSLLIFLRICMLPLESLTVLIWEWTWYEDSQFIFTVPSTMVMAWQAI